MDVVDEDMKIIGVREEEKGKRVRRGLMIPCADPSRDQL